MEKDREKKRKRLKLLISISLSGTLLLATILFVMWFIILQDQNRNQHVRSDKTYNEIITKNYVKAFEDTKNSGKFSYFLPDEDVNDLLDDGVKAIKDKHIESIYFEYSENGTHVFYVDLKRTFIKTRVVLTTYVEDYGDDYVNLKILTTKIGKLECTKRLQRKGYLTSKWLDSYFEASHLPMSYDEGKQIIKVEIKKYIKDFPETKISKNFFNLALKDKQTVSINPGNLGFSVDFSKIRSMETIEFSPGVDPISNFYNELKDGCESVDFSTLSVGESAVAYSIEENILSNLLKASISSELKETISYGASNVTFDLVDAQTEFKPNDEIDVNLIFSLNGYLVNSSSTINLYDYSTNYFDASIEINYDDEFAAEFLEEIFEKVQENTGNFVEFNKTQGALTIDMADMNASFVDSSLRDSFKTVEVNYSTKTIDFIVTKII